MRRLVGRKRVGNESRSVKLLSNPGIPFRLSCSSLNRIRATGLGMILGRPLSAYVGQAPSLHLLNMLTLESDAVIRRRSRLPVSGSMRNAKYAILGFVCPYRLSTKERRAVKVRLTQAAAEDEAERSLLRLCCDSHLHELVCRSRVSCLIELALAVLATTTVDDELSYVVLWTNVSYWFVYEGGHQLAGRLSWVLLGQVCVSRAVDERLVDVLVLLAAEGVDSLLQRQAIGHPW
jgi:hypothetical protein